MEERLSDMVEGLDSRIRKPAGDSIPPADLFVKSSPSTLRRMQSKINDAVWQSD